MSPGPGQRLFFRYVFAHGSNSSSADKLVASIETSSGRTAVITLTGSANATGVGNGLAIVDDPAAAREALVRIGREALVNAARHGEAQLIRVRLASDRATELEIVDDGTGFDTEEPCRDRTRFGLVSMRERAPLLGGDLLVRSQPGRGTQVKVVLPR